MSTRTRLTIITVAVLVFLAWVVIDANTASADTSGLVVSCTTVQVWDHTGLGTVTVTRTAGTDTHTPGNALTVPLTTARGTVTAVTTAHHSYVVAPPAGCVSSTTTSSTTTTAPPVSVPSSTTTTPAPPGTAPPVSVPPVSSTVPEPVPPAGSGTTTTLPTAPPAQPVVTTVRFTG